MKDYLKKGKQAISSLKDSLSINFESSVKLFKEVVEGLPVFSSLETSKNYEEEYDEKHYFVIPFYLSDNDFALHTMRCLPEGAKEINSLPKRRVFHFPSNHYESLLFDHMLNMSKEMTEGVLEGKSSSLEKLANDIDSLDKKLTYGMLLVGGVAAIFNPLIGAGIAAKALIPGIGSLLNKYGIKPIGEKMTRDQLEKQIKAAEEEVQKQFSDTNTLKVINPILQELELALNTKEWEHDPLLDPNLADGSIPELDSQRWRELTEIALFHIYKDVLEDRRLHKEARLGPEDIRWLEAIFMGLKSN